MGRSGSAARPRRLKCAPLSSVAQLCGAAHLEERVRLKEADQRHLAPPVPHPLCVAQPSRGTVWPARRGAGTQSLLLSAAAPFGSPLPHAQGNGSSATHKRRRTCRPSAVRNAGPSASELQDQDQVWHEVPACRCLGALGRTRSNSELDFAMMPSTSADEADSIAGECSPKARRHWAAASMPLVAIYWLCLRDVCPEGASMHVYLRFVTRC